MNRLRLWPLWCVILCLGLMPSDGVAQVVVEDPAAADAQPQPIVVAQPLLPAPVQVVELEERVDDVESLFQGITNALEAVETPVALPPAAAPAAVAAPMFGVPVAVDEAPVDDPEALFQGIVDALEGITDPNIRNMERELKPQFQQLLYSELAFVRRVCDTDAGQFAEVAHSARRQLGVAVREYVVAQNAMNQGQAMVGAQSMVNPRTALQEQIASLVESKLTPEQATRYREECDRRAASRKRAAVLNVVARLDEQLVLTAEQRAKMVQSLASDYQNSWEQWLELQIHNAEFLPEIPESAVAPLLNEKQKTVWEQIPKQNLHFFGVLQFGGAPGFVDPAEFQDIQRIVEEGNDDE